MKTSLQNIKDIFINPKAAFARLKNDPKWTLAFALCCIGFVLVELVTDPFETHILSAGLTQKSTITDTSHINHPIIEFLVSILVSGFMLLILFTVFSTFYLGIARLFRISRTILKFSHIYICLVHIFLVSVCFQIVNTVLLLIFKSPQDIHAELDMQMIPGLHHILSFLENEKLLIILSDINLLSIWEILLTTIAVGILIGVDRSRAILVAVCLWLVPVVLSAIFY